MRSLPVLAVLAVMATGVAAQAPNPAKALFSQLYPAHQSLAEGWEEALRDKLATVARENGDAENLAGIAEIEDLIDRERFPFDISELIGTWRMRSMQVDGLGAYVYQYFPARIYAEGDAIVFDKDSGSQRHRGLLAQIDPETVFFAGALYYGYEEPRTYSAFPDGEGAASLEFDAVAEIYKLGPGHFLMAFAPDGAARLYEIRR